MDIEFVRSRFIKHFDGTTGSVPRSFDGEATSAFRSGGGCRGERPASLSPTTTQRRRFCPYNGKTPTGG